MNLTASTLDFSAPSSPLKAAPRQLVFIDRNVPDYHALTAGVLPELATILVNLDTDGIDQITRVLDCHKNLTAIHIVSHGAPGSVRLGNGYLELENIDGYTQRLNAWSKSLAPKAEILLYGCEVAQGGRGAAMIWWLGELTQARIVAKASKTGNAELGGDWDLDASVPLAFTAEVMAEYQGVLADIPGTSGNDNLTGTPDNDTITGLAGNDNLSGGAGNDNISGGAGVDIIKGDAGDDTLASGTSGASFGNFDNVDGGADTDILVVDYSTNTYFSGIVTEAQNFTNGTGGFYAQNTTGNFDGVRYSNIERFNITGTEKDDNISGGNLNDVLTGGAGNDLLDGRTGVDTIDGGIGNDTAGADISTTTTATNINLANSTNTLANGTQLLNIEAVNIKLGSADDTVIAGNFNDTVDGGDGNDVIDVKNGINVVTGGIGNDTITSGTGADNLSGGAGNDDISGGGGVDIIKGDAGNDTLASGTSGASFGNFDNVDGGADTDILVVDYSTNTYFSGIVTEAQNFTNGTGGFYAQNTTGNFDGVRYSNIERFNITGTEKDDNISGGNLNDVLIGGAGNDLLDGRTGVDTIDGGIGNDTAGADIVSTDAGSNIDLSNAVNTLANGTKFTNIEAVNLKLGIGDDKIIAGNFNDTVDGGGGNDVIDVKDGINTVTGGIGNDTITSGSGADNLSGGAGNDNISGGGGVDIIKGDAGDDTLASGTSGASFGNFDNVDGGADTDILVVDYSTNTYFSGIVTEAQNFTNGTGGFYAQNTTGNFDGVRYSNIERFNITGTEKDDNISGGNLNDVLTGGAGNDLLDGRTGVDTIDGGAGNDTAGADISSSTSATNINLANLTNTLANGTQLLNIEAVNIKLGSADDTVIAGNFNDTVAGGDGNDVIDVKNGINVVTGGIGNDTITSGSGADNLSGGAGNDNISGGGGVDIIKGDAGDDTLASGTSGASFGNFDNVDGGADTDILVVDYSTNTYFSGIVTEAQNFTNGTGGFYAQNTTGNFDGVRYSNIERFNITGTEKNDSISGGNLNDILIGAKGNDTINGNGGNDTIIGVNSNDTTPGNAEIDTLTGGADNDIFVLSANGKDFYATSGNGDYAKITDFSLTQDVIQLRGAASDYSVTATTVGGSLSAVGGVTPPNTALFRGSELIAVLQGVDSTTVNLTSTAFSYSDFTVLNDLPPVVSISNATPVTEGQSGTNTATFNVKLSNPTTKTVTVPYTTADGTATTGDNDYVGATAGSLTFLPGETSKNISVVINGDTKIEPDETFSVTLGTPTNGTLATTTTATGTIVSDDTTVTISSTTNTAEGSTTPGQFTLTRAGVIATALTVPYTLTGTATNVSDYSLPLSATFAAGSATAVVNVSAIDDTLFEGVTPETVVLTLTPSTNYSIGTNTSTVSITDNDSLPTISVGNVAITEGNTGTSNAAFTVSLSNASTETVAVNLSTTDGTATIADNDYQAITNQSVTFTPGQTSQVVNVAVNGDLNPEDNETFGVVLSSPTNGVVSSTAGTGTGSINNNDLPIISVAVTDAETAETLTGQPANTGEFTFTRVGGIATEKTFLYNLSGTSTNGSDYTLPGSVTFAAGSSTAKVILTPTDDNIFEGVNPETAILTLRDDFVSSLFGILGNDRAATYRIDSVNNTATVSIAENDLRPTINIADSTPRAEGNTGTSNTPFTVTLSNPTVETVTVDYAAANGTATTGEDFTATTGTVTFTPLSTSKTINVPVIGDQIGEGDETYSVNLTNAVGGSIGKATATGTILNDESGISVSISDSDAGEANNNNGQFFLTRSGELTNPVTVNYTLGGTATAGIDYQAIPNSVTFAANQATASIDLRVLDDTIFEGATAETVTLTITPSTNYVVSSANSGTIDLIDNDRRPVISVSNSTVAEGNTGISKAGFTVSLSNASTEAVTVNLSTADGTATVANADYQAVTNQTVTFTPGQTSQVVDVDISGDLTFEANETFSAVLSNPTNGTISATAGTGTGTINNDDLPTISVAVTDTEAAETLTGQPTNLGEFTFTRVGGEAVEKTFLYNLNGTANGSDYSLPGAVTFAAGSTTAKVTLNPTDDNIFEGATPETVILTLKDDSVSSPTNFFVASDNRPATYRIDPANNTGTISIADNDRRPNISIADTSVTEGNTSTNNAAFTVTLSNPSTETVTVKYTAGNGTATADGNDYTPTTGTITFTPGQISQVVTVPIVGDLRIEGDETFTVTLSDAVSATGITRATATGTILDNDNGINVGIANPNITEGASGIYTLTRTGDLTAAIDIAYTLSGTATSADYQAVAGVATFAAGADTTLVNLATIDDTIFEGATPESVILTLTPSANYLLGNSNTGTINIADNDSRPVISISNAAIAEGNVGSANNAGFTVSLSNASTETVTVNLSTQDGTATTANSDYQALANQTITFAPGQISQVVNVAINGDTAFEANETFSAGLSNGSNGVVSSIAGTGTGTINNDDLPTISVAVTDADAAETLTGQPTNSGEFTFTRSGITTEAKTVLFSMSGTAGGADYTIPGSVTFSAGSNTATLSLSSIDDNIFEGATPETAILSLRDDRIISFDGILGNDRPATYLIDGVSNTGTVNIADNDLRPTVTIADATQVEGNSLNNLGFNLTLSNPTVETVTVKYNTADGTATIAGTANTDADYQAGNGTTTFNPLQTTQTINVAINGDKDFEIDETFAVNLSDAQNTSGITLSTATGKLTNDDTLPAITVAATTPISTEGTGEGLFTFYRTGGNLDRSLTIDFDVLGNATSRQGYGSRTGSITFAAGSNTATLGVPVANNSVYSAFRGCIVQLRSGFGYSIGSGIGSGGAGGSGGGGGGGGAGGSGGGAGGSGGGAGGFGGSSATVTIVDDDTAPVISISDATVTEGNDGTKDLTFTVSLNNASDDVVKVDYASADGTATAVNDYLATTGILSFTPSDIIAGTTEFTPGETSKTITVKINGDTEIETNETFALNLTNVVGGSIGKATGIGTIVNDDLPPVPVVVVPAVVIPAPVVTIPDVIVAPAVVIPTPIDTVPVPVVIVPPNVVNPAPVVPIPDVIATPVVVIPTPIDTVTVPVVIVPPNVVNPAPVVPIPDVIVTPVVVIPTPIDTVTVPVVIVPPNVVNPAPVVPIPDVIAVPDVLIPAPIALPIATNPIITVVATNPTSTEGIGEGLFTFARTGGDLNTALTIDFDLSGNATTRQGYGTRTGSVTFVAGSNTATLGVPVANNTVYNAARGCIVTLRKGSGYSFDETIGTAKVNIIDDEQAPVISIDDVTITEANGTKDLTFTVALSNASDDIVTVDYASADGTANSDCDYTATTGTLSFAPSDLIPDTTSFTPGETCKTITIKIDGDTDVEDTETFRLNLKNAVGGSIGKATGTGTIENDDLAPVIVDSTPLIPAVIEQPSVIVDPKLIIPINNPNPNPNPIGNNNQLLGSSLQNIAKIIDLQSVGNNQTVQATFSVQRSAGYDNHVSFYKVEDAQGTIISQTGITFKPGDAGYLTTAIQNRLTNIDLLGINGETVTSRSNVQGGAIYAPLIVTNNKPDSANLDFSNVYTAYSAANADKIEHIRLLGDNTFGFEDTRSGGDKDFNDTIVQANFTIATNPQDLVLDIVKLTPTSTAVNLNLTSYAGQTLKADITTTSNAAYDDNVGFYAVEDTLGTIKLSNGSFVKPGDANYAVEAIKSALTNSLQAGKSDTKTDLNITGGKIYAPVVVAQGTLNDFVAKNPTNGGGANEIHAYFNYLGANSDKANHFCLIGDNTFGVEDMYGGGDKDFNDLVVSLKVKA
jgi:Ca2+-binding RTX toxin-like protein